MYNRGYLIYHPERSINEVNNGLKIYHDQFGGNEDPYLWNDRFLHTFCHITQLKNEPGQINFWVSGDKWPNFNALYCDCIFVIQKKCFWENRNYISLIDPIVDNKQCFEHHYKWGNLKPDQPHYFKRRYRYTLKADPKKSFQPQDKSQNLIDIIPFLQEKGYSIDYLRDKIITRRGSKPFKLPDVIVPKLYNFLSCKATIKIKGKDIKDKHPNFNSENNSNNCC